jgi:hypothetical protein
MRNWLPRRNAEHFGGEAKSHFCRSRQVKIASMQFLSENRIRKWREGTLKAADGFT